MVGLLLVNSPSIAVLSPTVGLNGNLNAQASFLNFNRSGNQSQDAQQVNNGSVGIGGVNSAVSR